MTVRREIIMKDLNYMSIAEDAISKIKKGAFLTVKAADALNIFSS
jgi:hypothetical protein